MVDNQSAVMGLYDGSKSTERTGSRTGCISGMRNSMHVSRQQCQ